jgi:hypothetical protein
MGEGHTHNHHGHGGGMPFGYRPGGGGGQQHMSPEDADAFFSHFFGGGDPFGSMGGRGGPNIQFGGGGQRRSARPAFGGSMGGHPGFGGSLGGRPRQEEKRYDAIHTGTVVSLRGLVSQPDRNGDRGEVQAYDPSTGRYIVKLEDTDETMKVKPSNLLQHVHIKLYGLESRPELNDERATILAWDAKNERYNVYIISISKAMGMRPENLVLEDGTVAQITGLVSKPELNGKWGTIKSWNRELQKYDVQLSADKIVRLKMENMRL